MCGKQKVIVADCWKESRNVLLLAGGLYVEEIDNKSRMTGDCHVRFSERLGAKFSLHTRLFSGIKMGYDDRGLSRVV